MKTAFRFLGIGFLISALMLIGLKFSNSESFSIPFLNNQETTTSSTTTVQSTTQTETQVTTSSLPVETTVATTTTSTEEINVTVEQNDYSDTVVKKLADAGIITDANGFLNYLVSNKLDVIIQNGTFKLKKGLSFEELGKILTTYPGN